PFRGGLGVFWIIILLQNPSSLQLEVTNLPIYQSGKGSKAIYKALGLPRTTVRDIIYKWRKHGTVENLPRSGRPTKITPKAPRQLIQEVTKTPQQHPKNCRPHLPQLRGHGGLVVSTFASHLQRWGFDSHLHRVCGVCMFSLCLGDFLR
ncbi:hypothetical protein QTP70_018660, partial [Hemibagrus guttatus]